MANKIKNNGFVANKQKEAEAKAAEAKANEKPVEPANLSETMKAVKSKIVGTARDEKGNIIGVVGGPKLTKVIMINGMYCLCHGDNEKELEADIKAANAAAKYINRGRIDLSEQLVEAGYKPKDVEEVQSSCGGAYILDYCTKEIRSRSGELVVDLSDLKSITDREDIKNLLIDRLNKKVEKEGDCGGCYDDDDVYGPGPYSIYDGCDNYIDEFDHIEDAIYCAYDNDDCSRIYIENDNGDVVWDSDYDC